MESLVETQGERAALFNDIDALVEAVVTQASPLDRIVVMLMVVLRSASGC